jgi:hypothetical protein
VGWVGVALSQGPAVNAGSGEPGATLAGRGLDHELWIAARQDGKAGIGTPDDPLDGSTQPKFDAILHALRKANTKNVTLHLGPGTFETVGSNGCMASDPAPGWWTDDGWNSYVFEGNLFEICDHGGPLLFNGNVANAIFRNNILRYADGQGSGSEGLNFTNPTNRGLIVTGNLIDSRLQNHVGKSVVFGKDDIDEKGQIRGELEFGPHPR